MNKGRSMYVQDNDSGTEMSLLSLKRRYRNFETLWIGVSQEKRERLRAADRGEILENLGDQD